MLTLGGTHPMLSPTLMRRVLTLLLSNHYSPLQPHCPLPTCQSGRRCAAGCQKWTGAPPEMTGVDRRGASRTNLKIWPTSPPPKSLDGKELASSTTSDPHIHLLEIDLRSEA